MSDAMRESMGDKAKSNLKPDSEKSYAEKGSEQLKGAADSVAGSVQPSDQKSTTQAASDTLGSGANDAQNQGKSFVDQASETLSGAAQSVQDTLGLGQNHKEAYAEVSPTPTTHSAAEYLDGSRKLGAAFSDYQSRRH
ncbi:hypothetical protein MBLNU230_g7570t1 [Neophaeotheca triangularis]